MLISRIPDDGGSEKERSLVVRAKVVDTKTSGTCQDKGSRKFSRLAISIFYLLRV